MNKLCVFACAAAVAMAVAMVPRVSAALAEEPSSACSERLAHGGSIDVSWERSGHADMDARAEAFAQTQVSEFRQRAAELERDMAGSQRPIACAFEVRGTVLGTSAAVAYLWRVREYLGGAHSSLDLYCQLYDAKTGGALEADDLFALPEVAEQVFSSVARRELLARGLPEEMVEQGTAAGEGSFSIVIPSAEGVTLYFPPYQVAPWSEGVQEVQVSLEELAEARPVMRLWGR